MVVAAGVGALVPGEPPLLHLIVRQVLHQCTVLSPRNSGLSHFSSQNISIPYWSIDLKISQEQSANVQPYPIVSTFLSHMLVFTTIYYTFSITLIIWSENSCDTSIFIYHALFSPVVALFCIHFTHIYTEVYISVQKRYLSPPPF